MTAPVLRLDDIAVHAGGRLVLDVKTFTLAPGEIVALVGPNGAGKTTLLHVAALLRRPSAGVVAIRGERAKTGNAATLRRAISVVFQDPLLFDVSALANAAAGLRFQGCSRAEAERRAYRWLERFGVAHLAPRKARHLSGGEASRVALARAFATEPALLLLDEPFSPLDAPTRAALLPTLHQRIHETGAAAVLVTHDLDEALAFAGRLALMERGRIVATGAAHDLLARPPTRETAALLGIENLLPATVDHVGGECTLLALTPGAPLVRVQAPAAPSLYPGQRVTLTLPTAAARAIRPGEDAPHGWNQLPGAIASATPQSTGTRLLVETPAPVAALASWQSPPWLTGDPAIVTFPPEAAHIIPDRS
jgi:tungstate transport system ATP-binding protein